MRISRKNGIYAVYGGLFLGGGGGGSFKDGLNSLEKALEHTDHINLVDLSELDEQDIIITASMVGAPSSSEKFVDEEHWKRVYDLFEKNTQIKIKGIITNENGGTSTTNGWILSAVTKIPIIDAPCNGRAHPTGTMGSMGLTSIDNYRTIQTAAGGRNDKNTELLATGSISSTSKLVRQAAVEGGGLVCVLRNPVEKAYVEQKGASGAIKQAIEIGEVIYKNKGSADIILESLSEMMDSKIICRGKVKECNLTSTGGFDVGHFYIEEDGVLYETTFWNEYMTVESSDGRLATFPDLIVTLDSYSGMPVTSAEIEAGQDVIILKIPKCKIKLGGGMFEKDLFVEAEKVTGKEIIKYSF